MVDARRQHNRYQHEMFDSRVDSFKKKIPLEVRQRLQQIVMAAKLTAQDSVLDVGTGIGVLIPYIQDYHVRRIVGCDLSAAMLAEAKFRHPGALFVYGDIIDFSLSLGRFDAIFFNAMFGNIWDQRSTLEKASSLLQVRGRIIISHPLGASFVKQLSYEDPKLVPHPLPSLYQLAVLVEGLGLDVHRLEDRADLYICVLQRHTH